MRKILNYKMKKLSRCVLSVAVAITLVVTAISISGSAAPTIEVPGVGWEGQGADLAIEKIDTTSKPDMILMAYDAPSGANTFRYKIGWNLNSNGVATGWSDTIEIPGVGWEGQGAGITTAKIDTNTRPDMVLMAYDNPGGANTFRYKIGWNLDTTGNAASWSDTVEIPGVGWEGQGASVAIKNLDSNSRPDMILMAYDNPVGANTFRYKIGWNLDTAGIAASWSDTIEISGVGWEGQGAGIAIGNVDSYNRPEMILMAYDNPVGANTFRYKIGWNLNTAGIATGWSTAVQRSGVGWEGQGAGVAIYDLNGDKRPEMVVMAYDNPGGANTFRYKVLKPNYSFDE